MPLVITIREDKKGKKALALTRCRQKYKLEYKNNNQEIVLKSNIEDREYANYLYDMFLNDLSLK